MLALFHSFKSYIYNLCGRLWLICIEHSLQETNVVHNLTFLSANWKGCGHTFRTNISACQINLHTIHHDHAPLNKYLPQKTLLERCQTKFMHCEKSFVCEAYEANPQLLSCFFGAFFNHANHSDWLNCVWLTACHMTHRNFAKAWGLHLISNESSVLLSVDLPNKLFVPVSRRISVLSQGDLFSNVQVFFKDTG